MFQVKILFSDKTGTLTKNEMILQQCSINGKKFKIMDGGIMDQAKHTMLKVQQYHRDVLLFFQALAVCHTVQVGNTEEEDIEKSFEIVESTDSLVDLEEDVQTSVETRQNTIQNEINAELNLLVDNVTIRNEGNSTYFAARIFLKLLSKSCEILVRSQSQHKRTESTLSGRKISFNLEKTVYPLSPEHSLKLATLPSENSSIEPPTPPFLPKAPPPHRVEYKRAFSSSVKADRQERVKLGHRRTQSCTTPCTQPNHSNRKNSDLRKVPLNRSSMNICNAREYYAAPAYNEASLLERKESMRSTVRVSSVVE